MKCPNCGSELKEGTKFCGNCGAENILQSVKDVKGKTFCPNCGAEAAPGVIFCGKCGSRLSSPSVEHPVIPDPYIPPQKKGISNGVKRLLITLAVLGICISFIGLDCFIFKNKLKKDLNNGFDSFYTALPKAAEMVEVPFDSSTELILDKSKNLILDNIPAAEGIIKAFFKNDDKKILENMNSIINSVNKIQEDLGVSGNSIEPVNETVFKFYSGFISQMRTMVKNNYPQYWYGANIFIWSLWIMIGGLFITAASITVWLVFGGKISDIVTLKMIPVLVVGVLIIFVMAIVHVKLDTYASMYINILHWPQSFVDVFGQLKDFLSLMGQ